MAFDFTRKVLLAPMAGVTDPVMRLLCREQGADLAYTEMVSSKGLSYANEKTRHLLDLGPGEELVAVQLFGHEPLTMARQAAWVQDELGEHLAYIDVNMGCPARKITSKGDGSALMRDPALAAAIVREASQAVAVPLTCKFRRGYEMGRETAVEFGRALEQAGASALTLHGRYAQQMYQGTADWDCIGRLRQAVSVPVIGNGDIRCGGDALAMLESTGCDGVMVARAAEGNPWVFAGIRAALDGRDAPAPPTASERIAMARRHARLLAERGARLAPMRKHACWYLAGLPGAAKMRDRLNHCTSLEDFEAAFDDMESHAPRPL